MIKWFQDVLPGFAMVLLWIGFIFALPFIWPLLIVGFVIFIIYSLMHNEGTPVTEEDRKEKTRMKNIHHWYMKPRK
jgi:uncharacterized membrane protein